ncbi:hypothetical protein [Spirochaeta dissipatitropha]
MRSKPQHTGLVFLFLLTAAVASYAQTGAESRLPPAPGFQHEFRAGPWWIGNGAQLDGSLEKVHGSAVSPLRTVPGYAFIYNMTPSVSFIFGLDLLYQEYLELPSGAPFPGKTVPADKHSGSDSPYLDLEAGELQNVAGVFLLPLQISADFPLIRRQAFRSGPGIGLILLNRIPVLIEGNSTAGIVSSFWGGGNFILPELNWAFAFSNLESVEYGFRLRSMWPLSAMISQPYEEVAWWDGLNLQLQFFIRPLTR